MQRGMEVFLIFAIIATLSISISNLPMVTAQAPAGFDVFSIRGMDVGTKVIEKAGLKPNEIVTSIIYRKGEEYASLMYDDLYFTISLGDLKGASMIRSGFPPVKYAIFNLMSNEYVLAERLGEIPVGERVEKEYAPFAVLDVTGMDVGGRVRDKANLRTNEVVTSTIFRDGYEYASLMYNELYFTVLLMNLTGERDVSGFPGHYVAFNLLDNEKVIHDSYLGLMEIKKEIREAPAERRIIREKVREERLVIAEEREKEIIRGRLAPEPETIEDINNLLKNPQVLFLIVALFFAIIISIWTEAITAIIGLGILLVVGTVMGLTDVWVLMAIALLCSAVLAVYISKGVTG